MVNDRKVDVRAAIAKKHAIIPLITAVAQTDIPFFFLLPGHGWQLTEAYLQALTEVDAMTVNLQKVGASGILKAPATIVEGGTTHHLNIALARFRVSSKTVVMAANTDFAYTAAHVVTALKFGIILLQVSNVGVYTTKVPAATPTTAMAYDSSALALAALPAADANNIAVAHAIVEADAGNWVANTDDHSTDLTAFTVTINPAIASMLDSALAGVSNSRVAAVLETATTDLRGERTEGIQLSYTTDADAALTHGFVELLYRPWPLNKEGAGISDRNA